MIAWVISRASRVRSSAFSEHSRHAEIAYRAGWISAEQVEALARPLAKNGYGQYLQQILREDRS